MTTSASRSTSQASTEPRARDDDPAPEPVRHGTTSANAALLWVVILVLSFLATLALLFWAAARIP